MLVGMTPVAPVAAGHRLSDDIPLEEREQLVVLGFGHLGAVLLEIAQVFA